MSAIIGQLAAASPFAGCRAVDETTRLSVKADRPMHRLRSSPQKTLGGFGICGLFGQDGRPAACGATEQQTHNRLGSRLRFSLTLFEKRRHLFERANPRARFS